MTVAILTGYDKMTTSRAELIVRALAAGPVGGMTVFDLSVALNEAVTLTRKGVVRSVGRSLIYRNNGRVNPAIYGLTVQGFVSLTNPKAFAKGGTSKANLSKRTHRRDVDTPMTADQVLTAVRKRMQQNVWRAVPSVFHLGAGA